MLVKTAYSLLAATLASSLVASFPANTGNNVDKNCAKYDILFTFVVYLLPCSGTR